MPSRARNHPKIVGSNKKELFATSRRTPACSSEPALFEAATRKIPQVPLGDKARFTRKMHSPLRQFCLDQSIIAWLVSLSHLTEMA